MRNWYKQDSTLQLVCFIFEEYFKVLPKCPDDISQTNARNTNTYVPKKSKRLPTCVSYLLSLLSDQMQNTPKGLSC